MPDGLTFDTLQVVSLTGGTYQLDTNLGAGNADEINVTGNVTVNPNSVTFELADIGGPISIGDRATILTAANATAAFDASTFVLANTGGAVVQLLEATGNNLEVVARGKLDGVRLDEEGASALHLVAIRIEQTRYRKIAAHREQAVWFPQCEFHRWKGIEPQRMQDFQSRHDGVVYGEWRRRSVRYSSSPCASYFSERAIASRKRESTM